ncbi:hypothetical protein FOMPIDRAFT_1048027, partial [Fomitopsis schrenkii]
MTSSEAWAKCARDAWAEEESRVKKLDDEIDTLLVFAALFSAVLTAFIVQYYATLQTGSPGSSPQSMVVSGGTAAGDIILNVTFSASGSSSTPPWSVAINALWYTALVLSIAAASLAISVKQWLAHYIPSDSEKTIARMRLPIWHLRSHALREWHVSEVVTSLLLLLQISLVLFLVGTTLLLWSFTRIVIVRDTEADVQEVLEELAQREFSRGIHAFPR